MLAHPQTVQYTQRVYERPIVECNLVSGLCFTFNGGECLIVPKVVRAHSDPVTYRLRDMLSYGCDLHEAFLDGSDGSQLSFFVTTEDVIHSIAVAETATNETVRLIA